MITMLASVGLPMLSNFVGEYLVLQGAAAENFNYVIPAATGAILSACYMLWLYQRVFFGEAPDEVRHHVFDLKPREWAAVAPLIAMMLWMGMYSQSFLPAVSKTTSRILDQTQVNVQFRVKAVGQSSRAVQSLPTEVAHAR
jgi:NADH-quinone oxidoreductase subunit M